MSNFPSAGAQEPNVVVAVWAPVYIIARAVADSLAASGVCGIISASTRLPELLVACEANAGCILVCDGSCLGHLHYLLQHESALMAQKIVAFGLSDSNSVLRCCATLNVRALLSHDAEMSELGRAVVSAAAGEFYCSKTFNREQFGQWAQECQ